MGSGSSAIIKAQVMKNDYTFPSSGKMVDHESYQDEDFDFDDQLPYLPSSSGRVSWLRPHQFGSGGIFGGQAPQPDDVIKGRHIYSDDKETDRSLNHLVLVLCALCKREDYLNQLFVFYNSTAGVVAMKFWMYGHEEIVVMDDFIPCDAYTSQPLFAFSESGFCWLPFILKGLAKLHGSYYNIFACGASCREFFRDLTGEVVVSNQLAAFTSTGSRPDSADKRASDKYSDVNSHFLLGIRDCKKLFCAIRPRAGGGSALIVCSNPVREEAVLALRERVLGARLSEEDLQAVCFLPLQHAVEEGEDDGLLEGGSTVRSFSSLLGDYDSMHVCLMQAERRWEACTRVAGRWDANAGSNGGSIDSSDWRSNVLYRLTVSSATPSQATLLLGLSVKDRRAASGTGAGRQSAASHYYPNIALSVCEDHPRLDLLAHSISSHRRDAAIEFEWQKGCRSYIVVPSCYDKSLSEDFSFTCVLLSAETGRYIPLTIEPATTFSGFDYIYSGLSARWAREQSSFGRISGVAPQRCALNPCWRLRLRFKERLRAKLKLKICMILESTKEQQQLPAAPEDIIIPESAIARRGRASPFLSTGVYLFTSDFLSRLMHFEGRLLPTDVQFGPKDPGLLGSFAFVYEPISCVYQEVIVRAEDFKDRALSKGSSRIKRDVLTQDYLLDMIVMPSTYAAGDEGEFRLIIMTSEAVEVQRVDPSCIAPPREHFTEVYRTRYKQSSQPLNILPEKQFLIDNIRTTCLRDSSLTEVRQSVFDDSRPDRLVLRKRARNIKKKFDSVMAEFEGNFGEVAAAKGLEDAAAGSGEGASPGGDEDERDNRFAANYTAVLKGAAGLSVML